MSDQMFPLLVAGVVVGSVYSLAAAGLVLTYRASGVLNFAHGAIGMMGGFAFADLVQRGGLPPGLAAPIVVILAAPALGIGLHLLIFRRLRNASALIATVASVGVLIALQGLATAIWGRAGLSAQRIVEDRVLGSSGPAPIGADQALVIAVAGIACLLLWVLLRHTRFGIGMRAAVDDPDLAESSGCSTRRIAAVSWGLGAALAALSGILLTPMVSLEVYSLTLLVINSYAVAAFARLESLPLTLAGGLILGVAEAAALRILPQAAAPTVRACLPFAMLLIALLVPRRKRWLPARDDAAPIRSAVADAALTAPAVSRFAGAVRVLAILAATGMLIARLPADLGFAANLAIVHAILFLSMVIVTGAAGQISFAQSSLAGIGGIATAHLVSRLGWPLLVAMPIAGLAAVPVGALLALSAVRLRGIALALATLAFAALVDASIFANTAVTGGSSGIRVARPEFLRSDGSFALALMVIFAGLAWATTTILRGRLGRALRATRDAAQGAAAIGIPVARVKLIAFCLGAFVAGVGGSGYVAAFERVDAGQFIVYYGIAWLAVAVVGGIESWRGALAGGILYSIVPFAIGRTGSLAAADLSPVLFGLAAIGLARYPGGIASALHAMRSCVAVWLRKSARRFDQRDIRAEVTSRG